MICALLPEGWRSADLDVNSITHTEPILAQMEELLNGSLADVTITVHEKKFAAHKLILSMRSAVFRAMFEQKMFESQTAKVVINDSGIDPQSFADFLSYLYTGSIRLSSLNVLTVLYLSKMHMMTLLESECVKFLEAKVTVEDVLCVLEAARFMAEERVIALCWNLIRENCAAVLDSSHFCNISLTVLEQLLSDDHIVVEELHLFLRLHEYIRQNRTDAIKIKHLLSFIRFGCISMKDIVERVKPAGLLLPEQYIEALEVHISPPVRSVLVKQRGQQTYRAGVEGLPLCFSRESSLLGSGLILSPDYRTISAKAMLWRGARIDLRSVRSFAISIVRTSFNPFVMIGYGPAQFQPDVWDGKGWYFHCAYNCFFAEGNYSARKYNRILLEGSIIQVNFNARDQALSFVVNGQQTLGTVFVRNAHQDCFPTVWLYGDVAIRLIDPPSSSVSPPSYSSSSLLEPQKIFSIAEDVNKKKL